MADETSGVSTQGPVRVPLSLRWSDMDALGHVNNVQFLRLLEEARIHALDEWFGRAVDLRADADSTAVLVAAQAIEYLAPLHYRRDPIEVAIWITRLGESSFDVGYIVEADGQRCAVAQTTMVNVDVASSRPSPLTPKERELMSEHLGEPVPWRVSPAGAAGAGSGVGAAAGVGSGSPGAGAGAAADAGAR